MTRPGFFFCICPDYGLAKAHISEKLLSRGPDERVKVFWGDEGLDAQFWSALNLVSLQACFNVLIVRLAHALPASDWKLLSQSLATPHSSTLPVFCLECAWEKGKPKIPAHIARLKCLSFAEKQQWVWASPGLDRNSLRSYIQEAMRQRGLSAGSDVLAYLAEIAIPDATAVQSLLDQLGLAADEGRVTRSMVQGMASCAGDAAIFDIVRKLEHGDIAGAWKILRMEGDGGEAFLFPLLSLMAREARLLWQICAGEQVYIPKFLEGEKRKAAARLGFEGVSRLLDAVVDAERSVKSGERQPLHSLEYFMTSVSSLFSGR